MKNCLLCCIIGILAAIPIIAGENQTTKDKPIKDNYNIVMIVLDACRADHLGCYGYDRPTSPNIDKFAAESILFEQAYSQGVSTLVSFSSFFTGKYPSTLNVYWNGGGYRQNIPMEQILPNEELTLAKILNIYNYHTAAFPTGPHLSPILGLSSGFQIYTNNPDFLAVAKSRPNGGDFSQMKYIDFQHFRPAKEADKDEKATTEIQKPIWSFQDTLPLVLKYLKSINNETHPAPTGFTHDKKRKPFFLLAHTNDTHPPYDNPPEFAHKFDPDYQGPVCKDGRFQIDYFSIEGNKLITKNPADTPDKTSSSPQEEITLSGQDLKHIIAHYDGGVAYADNGVGKILKQLSESGLDQNTIVILLADHGDRLGERGHWGRKRDHFLLPSNELCHVPLIIKLPPSIGVYPEQSRRASRINTPVQLIDLMPTLLDCLAIPRPKDIDGISLKDLIFNNKPIPDRPVITEILPDVLAFQSGDWKLIYNQGVAELYNVRKDPTEKNNLADRPETKEIQEELIKKLKDWQKEHIAKRGSRIKDDEPNHQKNKDSAK